MTEYKTLGHMTKFSEPLVGRPHYFLSHHAVMKENNSTSKMHVVFDGSAASSSGFSLNNVQHIDPKMQNNISAILLRFRRHAYVLNSDINKFYRQILLTE